MTLLCCEKRDFVTSIYRLKVHLLLSGAAIFFGLWPAGKYEGTALCREDIMGAQKIVKKGFPYVLTHVHIMSF